MKMQSRRNIQGVVDDQEKAKDNQIDRRRRPFERKRWKHFAINRKT